MKPWRAFGLAGVVVMTAAMPRAQAQAVHPWCEWSSAFASGPDCSYWTFAQCMATARGDGTCQRNPLFDAPYFQRGIPAPVDVDPYGRPLRPKKHERGR